MTPQGSKSSYTSKQRRQAHHIEESEMKRGKSRRSAERIGWATVNKQDGGAKGKRRGGSTNAKKGSRSTSTRRAASRPKRGKSR